MGRKADHQQGRLHGKQSLADLLHARPQRNAGPQRNAALGADDASSVKRSASRGVVGTIKVDLSMAPFQYVYGSTAPHGLQSNWQIVRRQ